MMKLPDVDYQVKTEELANEILFLQKYSRIQKDGKEVKDSTEQKEDIQSNEELFN